MRNVRLLDCTLRDGGRIVDCKFPDDEIREISRRLCNARIDIVELGFLRDWRNTNYSGNSTFFTNPNQINKFVFDDKKTLFVAFIDFGMFDFDSLQEYKGKGIRGLRVGFTKKDYIDHRDEIIRCFKIVQEKGYLLFIQGVNTLGYSDKELVEIVDMVNDVNPYSFGIVDTYGAMYIDDLQRIYTLIDHNLKQNICIDFHSHNNFQLSFSFAQEIIKLSRGTRQIIIDGTLNGMGKVAGNLNTELIVDFMNRKLGYNYDYDLILDTIDDYIYKYKEEYQWGYSIPGVMAGVYKSHPNNVIYLTEKMRLATKDVKYMLSMIEPDLRQRYDYENIKELYKKYNHENIDDTASLNFLKKIMQDRELLLLFPGYSIDFYKEKIKGYIDKNKPVIITVNFIPSEINGDDVLYFFGSEKRYLQYREINDIQKCIVVSNIINRQGKEIVVNYETLVNREREYFDNTGIMLLNLLKRIGRERFAIAGFDGFTGSGNNYSKERSFGENRYRDKFNELNEDLTGSLSDYAKSLKHKNEVVFLTPSLFENIFKD